MRDVGRAIYKVSSPMAMLQGYLEGIKGSYNVSELLGLANLLRLLVPIECKDLISPHINRKSHAGQCRGRWAPNWPRPSHQVGPRGGFGGTQ